MKENVIVDKSFAFAVKIVKLYQKLVSESKEYVLSKQLLRCGTSIGANIEEAVGGISKRDFIAKLQISYKEARETKYWLRLMIETDIISKTDAENLTTDCDELIKIIVAIIKTSKG
ncbi:MAG: four helix bundle protein [Bacteroidetes bacterium]|nr:four helix bundle protein [Bacteroidota bacterium]